VKWAAPKADLDKLTLAEHEGVVIYLQRLRAGADLPAVGRAPSSELPDSKGWAAAMQHEPPSTR
jgi:hypothetical protein